MIRLHFITIHIANGTVTEYPSIVYILSGFKNEQEFVLFLLSTVNAVQFFLTHNSKHLQKNGNVLFPKRDSDVFLLFQSKTIIR